MVKNLPEVEDNWENFWKKIVTTENGVSLSKVKRELYDFYTLMQEAKKVYLAVTGHRTDNICADADSIIALFNAHVNDVVKEVIKDSGYVDDDIPF